MKIATGRNIVYRVTNLVMPEGDWRRGKLGRQELGKQSFRSRQSMRSYVFGLRKD